MDTYNTIHFQPFE